MKAKDLVVICSQIVSYQLDIMFDVVKDYWLKTKSYYELRKIEREYDRSIRQAQKAKKGEKEIRVLVDLMYHECEPIEREIRLLTKRKLLKTAQRLSLHVPPCNDNEMWEEDYGEWYLTTKGTYTIRKQIRDERKERRDFWLPWVCALAGLLGTLIGLVSTFKKN